MNKKTGTVGSLGSKGVYGIVCKNYQNVKKNCDVIIFGILELYGFFQKENYPLGSFFSYFRMMSTVIDVVGKAQFDEIVSKSDKLLFVDFWASRCGPCRMLGPVLHDIADKYADKVQIIKINVDEDENADLALQFEVRSIPQVTLFFQGKQVDQFIGVLPPEQVEAYVTKYIV